MRISDWSSDVCSSDLEVTGPINAGNPQETPVAALAELVIELTGSRSRLVFQPLPQDDPMQRCPDITKARRLLDWAPTVDLRRGLETTIGYFDATLSGGAKCRGPPLRKASRPPRAGAPHRCSPDSRREG